MNTFFKTTDEFIQHLSVNVNFSIEQIQSSLITAQERYLHPLLSESYVQHLLTAYDTSSATPAEAILIKKIQRAIAPLSFMLYLDIANVNINDDGIHISVNENQKVAFEWQVEKLRERLKDLGFSAIDSMLGFMLQNIGDYVAWQGTDAYERFNLYFIRRASEFQQYYNINSSTLVYMALLPKMGYVEDFIVGPKLCDYWLELKTKHETGTLTPADNVILPYLKKAIALFTISHGMEDFSIAVNVFGIVQFQKKSQSANIIGFENADAATVDRVSRNAGEEAQQYLNKCLVILHKNSQDYPTFTNSPCFTPTDNDSGGPRNSSEMRPREYASFFRS